MTPANRILFVKVKDEPFEHGPYVVHKLADAWRKRGLEIGITDDLSQPTGPEVLVFPHFDLTRTPPRMAAVLGRCARVVNRAVTDISKRVVSRHLVSSPEEYPGAVIVKSDLNFGGMPEARLIKSRGGDAAREIERREKQHWAVSGLFGNEGYPIFAKSEFVPPRAWKNPRIVIEKFLPEMEGEGYCLRQYVFLGPCEINSRSVGPHPLVKSRNVLTRETIEEVPPAVRQLREELGFDYGKFDYVIHDGEPIVFDVSRTPTYNPASKTGSAESKVLALSSGIDPFLGVS